jgi:uncharacterized protein (DUF952 family)
MEGVESLLYHLALLSDWETARKDGEYRVSTRGVTLDQEGFIHTSFPHQTLGVAERYYADVTEPLVLLHIEEERLTAPWRVDPVAGDAHGFPHVYGPIPVAAVTRTTPVHRDPATGTWTGLPPAIE